jgi:hypothetical protein
MHVLSRNSFNIAFPHLVSGGIYILEDWAWSHWPSRVESKEPALTNLVFELIVAAGSRPDIIEELMIDRDFVAIRRGPANLPSGQFDLGSLCSTRGKPLPTI